MPRFLIIVFCKFYGSLKESFNAMGLVTILLSLNVFTVIGYFKTLIKHSDQILIPTNYELLIIFLIGLFNYNYFLKGKRYENIYKEFTNDASISGARGTRITAIYIVVTVLTMTSLIWIGRMYIKK